MIQKNSYAGVIQWANASDFLSDSFHPFKSKLFETAPGGDPLRLQSIWETNLKYTRANPTKNLTQSRLLSRGVGFTCTREMGGELKGHRYLWTCPIVVHATRSVKFVIITSPGKSLTGSALIKLFSW
jgi:hypothetical protein